MDNIPSIMEDEKISHEEEYDIKIAVIRHLEAPNSNTEMGTLEYADIFDIVHEKGEALSWYVTAINNNEKIEVVTIEYPTAQANMEFNKRNNNISKRAVVEENGSIIKFNSPIILSEIFYNKQSQKLELKKDFEILNEARRRGYILESREEDN